MAQFHIFIWTKVVFFNFLWTAESISWRNRVFDVIPFISFNVYYCLLKYTFLSILPYKYDFYILSKYYFNMVASVRIRRYHIGLYFK